MSNSYQEELAARAARTEADRQRDWLADAVRDQERAIEDLEAAGKGLVTSQARRVWVKMLREQRKRLALLRADLDAFRSRAG